MSLSNLLWQLSLLGKVWYCRICLLKELESFIFAFSNPLLTPFILLSFKEKKSPAWKPHIQHCPQLQACKTFFEVCRLLLPHMKPAAELAESSFCLYMEHGDRHVWSFLFAEYSLVTLLCGRSPQIQTTGEKAYSNSPTDFLNLWWLLLSLLLNFQVMLSCSSHFLCCDQKWAALFLSVLSFTAYLCCCSVGLIWLSPNFLP